MVVDRPTALTGFVDWLSITRGTPLWRTATAHMIAMLTATVFFLVSIGAGYGDGIDGTSATAPFLLTLIGFLMLTAAAGSAERSSSTRDARAEPGRGTGEPCRLADPSTGRRSQRRASYSAREAELRSSAPFGCAPTATWDGSPSLKRTIVGIETIP